MDSGAGPAPGRARASGAALPALQVAGCGCAVAGLVLAGSGEPSPVRLAVPASAAVLWTVTVWGLRRGHLTRPRDRRRRALSLWGLTWTLVLLWLTAAEWITDPAPPEAEAGPAFVLGFSVLTSVVWAAGFGAAERHRAEHPPAPLARRSAADLPRARRRALSRAIRAGAPLAAGTDRDVRAVVHRILDLEIVGWLAAAAALVLAAVAVTGLTTRAWWTSTSLAALGLTAGVAAVVVLTLVAAAKRRQRWLNAHRPGPHLERPAAAPTTGSAR